MTGILSSAVHCYEKRFYTTLPHIASLHDRHAIGLWWSASFSYRLPGPANLLAVPNMTALVNNPPSKVQARATAPPIMRTLGMLFVQCFGFSISMLLLDELASVLSSVLSSSALNLVVTCAMAAHFEIGSPAVLATWYARRPGSILLTQPHIPCRTPSFAISHGIPISSWWNKSTSHAVIAPSPFLDSTGRMHQLE